MPLGVSWLPWGSKAVDAGASPSPQTQEAAATSVSAPASCPQPHGAVAALQPEAQRVFVNIASARECGGVSVSGSAAPTAGSSNMKGKAPSSCAYGDGSAPINGTGTAGINPLNNMPDNLASDPRPSTSLSLERERSSIPIATSSPPGHQSGLEEPVWVYPSEAMFYNAMKRKGWQPNEGDMNSVVAIHNTVNERAWREVLAYEALHKHTCDCPRLKRFVGRPTEYSPKARLLQLLGYKAPFDRHDWIVDRCGTEVRYVIDFYSGPPTRFAAAGMFIDVRPALDNLAAVADRLAMQFKWMASGRWAGEGGKRAPQQHNMPAVQDAEVAST